MLEATLHRDDLVLFMTGALFMLSAALLVWCYRSVRNQLGSATI